MAFKLNAKIFLAAKLTKHCTESPLEELETLMYEDTWELDATSYGTGMWII